MKYLPLVLVLGLSHLHASNKANTAPISTQKEKTMIIHNTFENYIKNTRFDLPYHKFSPEERTKTIHLADNTKIVYDSCDKKESINTEKISSTKYPFYVMHKSYYCDTQTIYSVHYEFTGTRVKTTTEYDKQGKVTKVVDHDEKSRKLDYSYLLKWAEEKKFLDIKSASMIGNNNIQIIYIEFDEENRKGYKEIYDEYHVPEALQKKAFSYKGHWRVGNNQYDIGSQTSYFFNDAGEFICDTGLLSMYISM